ncbi:hypothetical protein GFV16_01960 [Bacillus megaterium]|nr:hypothetical protein [Priestia megaterium]
MNTFGRPIWRFGRYTCTNKPIPYVLRFGYVGLAREPNLPKFLIQGEKSGDFLSGLFKKYYSYLVSKIACMEINPIFQSPTFYLILYNLFF